jgi:threonylcarbamoyladenosine tRNA methylthiotransferase MtaB
MPHLHLSLQHGHDLILKRMKRRHLRGDAVDLLRRLRVERPDLAVGADLIAGFPTEDDQMHAANLSIIEELNIVHGHIFPYSPRPNTPAARMPQVAKPVIKQRASELRNRVSRLRADWLTNHLGTPLEVLAEKDGTGYSPDFARVSVPDAVAAGTITTITPTHHEKGLLQ